jgi:transposase
MDLTDQQWAILAPLLPKPRVRRDGRGRPWRDPRDVLNGILWILRTGAPWKDLPERYPSYQTCHRRFQRWVHAGTLRRVLKALAADLHARGGLDLSETFIDGSFASAKKKGATSARPSAARGPRSWPWQTALVFLSPLPSPRRPRTKRGSSSKR